jgi:probable HAF family extracellular repeat protein
MVGVGDLPGGGFFSEAYGVSADGRVVVGRSAAADGLFPYRAFRWTAASGIQALAELPGIGPTATAEAISGDGNVIVGGAYSGDTLAAFAWDDFHGSRSIADLLTNQGVDLNGFDLGIARGVSFDGLTIVGKGVSADGDALTWIARLDSGTFVPEPSSFTLCTVLLGTGALVLLLHRRRRCSERNV